MGRVLITGINGFIGSHLAKLLTSRGWDVQALERDRPGGLALSSVDSIDLWARGLVGIDAIVHLAGIAHRKSTPAHYQSINADWPVRMFKAARDAGVGTFVHMSTIKVLGDISASPLTVQAPYRPSDHYAESKMAAEKLLLANSGTPTTLVIIRAPLIYGPGVKANFLSLLKLAGRACNGLPLPLGRADAPRSLLSRARLNDLLTHLIENPHGHSGIFHVADERDWAVCELLRLWGVPENRLWNLPRPLVQAACLATGQRGIFDRLYQPLRIDQTETNHTLSWQGVNDSAAHLEETFAWFRSNH